jgi:hypothetical protein
MKRQSLAALGLKLLLKSAKNASFTWKHQFKEFVDMIHLFLSFMNQSTYPQSIKSLKQSKRPCNIDEHIVLVKKC